MQDVLRFTFRGQCDREAVEADVALAIFTAECVYGRPRVRMETSYVVSNDGTACVMGTSGEAGEVAARVFAGLATARYGEDGYTVERFARPLPSDVDSGLLGVHA